MWDLKKSYGDSDQYRERREELAKANSLDCLGEEDELKDLEGMLE